MVEDRLNILRARKGLWPRLTVSLQAVLDFFQAYRAGEEADGWVACHGGEPTDVLECVATGACPLVLTDANQTSWLGTVLTKVFLRYSHAPQTRVRVTEWGLLERDQVMDQLYHHGPVVLYVSASVVASTDASGTMTKLDDHTMDHAVCVVGWEVIDGDLHWLVRNSWGSLRPDNLPEGYAQCNTLDKNECSVAYVPWKSIPDGPNQGLCRLPDSYAPLHWKEKDSCWVRAKVEL